MRSFLVILLIGSTLFGSGYWFYIANAACDVPISYRIGSIDSRFGLITEEVRNVVFEAESMWEDATGANLFTHDEEGEISINFIYDERQELADEEHELRNALEEREDISDQVKADYKDLLDEYEKLKVLYEQSTRAYDAQLDAYNQEVEKWNTQGGAPPEVYATLADRQKELSREQKKLNDISYQLNQLVKKMNAIGAQGNSVITDYNEIVEEYNNRFNETHEFTQGQYERGFINIYQFDSRDELEVVLAHEFGHALSLGHVEGETSIMFHVMEAQSSETGVTSQDLVEFNAVCGEKTFLEQVVAPLQKLVTL